MYTDYNEINSYEKNRKPLNKKIIAIIISVIIVVLGFIVINYLGNYKYKKMEKELVTIAKNFFTQSDNNFTQEIYLDSQKLGYSLPQNCSPMSGVIYYGDEITPYLSCDDYESDLESNKESNRYIKLNGNGIIILAKGMNYEEPGYISDDQVTVNGKVLSESGVYTIYYNDDNYNKLAQRKVIVLDSDINQFPKIYNSGVNTKFVLVNSNYDDNDVFATDSVDGDITSKIKRIGSFKLNTLGEYHIGYVVSNSRGYRSYISRIIKVVDHIINLDVNTSISPTKKTKNEVTINLNVTGENFSKIAFPDGMISQNKDSSYKVYENGTYKFLVYDNTGAFIEKEVTIDNIDKELPDGKCKVTLYGNRTKVVTDITSSRGIISYQYVFDGISSGEMKDVTYESTKKPSKVKVIVKDALNLETEFDCSISSTPSVYTDSTGKNCLEGYVCYIQFNYKSGKYPYCSMSTENSCGTISTNGCSITSTSIVISGFGVKSKSGAIFNPYTVWDEIYHVNKRTGKCDETSACSSWTSIKNALRNAGLSPAPKAQTLNRNSSTWQDLINHLKNGYPAIVHATSGAYTKGGHYMAIIGIRETDNYVFLTDPATWSGTYKSKYNGKDYYTDTFVSLSDLAEGLVDGYLLVGPSGYKWQ